MNIEVTKISKIQSADISITLEGEEIEKISKYLFFELNKPHHDYENVTKEFLQTLLSKIHAK